MTDIQFKNNAYSTLAADISAVSTSLSVQSGDGVLFPAISGSQYFRCTLYDASGNLEIIKVTARTVDSFGTIVRGEEGTTARAFTSGDRIALQLTDEGIRDKVGQEINDAVIQAAMPTLDKDSPEYIVLTPTAAGTLPLPTTGVPDGKRFCIVNMATTDGYVITVNSSGGNKVWKVAPGGLVEVVALQDAPTTAAHWAIVRLGAPPSFKTTMAADQSSMSFPTLANFDTKAWDRLGDYDATNKRFLPTIAGLWRFYTNVNSNASGAADAALVSFYKNGAREAAATFHTHTVAGEGRGGNLEALIDMNGTSDYVDVRAGYDPSDGSSFTADSGDCYFEGVFIGG